MNYAVATMDELEELEKVVGRQNEDLSKKIFEESPMVGDPEILQYLLYREGSGSFRRWGDPRRCMGVLVNPYRTEESLQAVYNSLLGMIVTGAIRPEQGAEWEGVIKALVAFSGAGVRPSKQAIDFLVSAFAGRTPANAADGYGEGKILDVFDAIGVHSYPMALVEWWISDRRDRILARVAGRLPLSLWQRMIVGIFLITQENATMVFEGRAKGDLSEILDTLDGNENVIEFWAHLLTEQDWVNWVEILLKGERAEALVRAIGEGRVRPPKTAITTLLARCEQSLRVVLFGALKDVGLPDGGISAASAGRRLG